MHRREAFITEQYHIKAAEKYGKEIPNRVLLEGYERSLDLVNQQKWQHPLQTLPYPNVLQIGTASFATSATFSNFVHTINPYASIVVADLYPKPLADSRANGLSRHKNISLARADITQLPFREDSFDLVETDALFQFLSAEEKKSALHEIFRVLSPGGIFTTRDNAISRSATLQEKRALDADIQYTFETFGIMPYVTTAESYYSLFTQQEFDTVIKKPEDDALLHDIVARKPTA